MTIKAIETSYKGYRFRSRLEARWAVFFDTIDWRWDYEPEGFEFDNKQYLPDFYLKASHCYVEVKPDDSEIANKADWLLMQFVCFTQQRAMLLVGLPSNLRAISYEPAQMENDPPVIRKLLDFSRLPNFESAAIAAKQARFEHGETP